VLGEAFNKAWAVITGILPDSKPLQLLNGHPTVIVRIIASFANHAGNSFSVTTWTVVDQISVVVPPHSHVRSRE
jgi:hypothetical protein